MAGIEILIRAISSGVGEEEWYGEPLEIAGAAGDIELKRAAVIEKPDVKLPGFVLQQKADGEVRRVTGIELAGENGGRGLRARKVLHQETLFTRSEGVMDLDLLGIDDTRWGDQGGGLEDHDFKSELGTLKGYFMADGYQSGDAFSAAYAMQEKAGGKGLVAGKCQRSQMAPGGIGSCPLCGGGVVVRLRDLLIRRRSVGHALPLPVEDLSMAPDRGSPIPDREDDDGGYGEPKPRA
ncbi:MAG: hypothetical protein NTU53_04870 [Planctomycetota bacterium]|nr:hypothetical protein [Planctomycetota bacterium]